jgi:hypothetical protein
MSVQDAEGHPFAPGESPFRIKGTAYRGHMAYAERHVPGGTAAMIAGLHDPRLRAFFEQPFLAASWYDMLPLLPAGRVCAALIGKDYEAYLRARTTAQVTADLGGVYRILLRVVSTETVALRLPKLLGQYLEFGSTSAKAVRPELVEVESLGMPRVLVPWFQPVSETYAVAALRAAGAESPRVIRHPLEPAGVRSGVRIVRYRWDIAWGD